MKYAWLGCLLWGSLLFAGTQDSETNVNIALHGGERGGFGPRDARSVRFLSDSDYEAGLVGETTDRGEAESDRLDARQTRFARNCTSRTVAHHLLRGERPSTSRWCSK